MYDTIFADVHSQGKVMQMYLPNIYVHIKPLIRQSEHENVLKL